MIDFRNFWCINEETSFGSYPMALFKGKNGYHIGPGDIQPDIKIFLTKEQLPSTMQGPGLAALYAIAYNPDARTDALHLLRFKHKSDITTNLSRTAVNRTVQLVVQKALEQSKLGKVKIVYPKSQSIFNDLVAQDLKRHLSQIPVIDLSKRKISDISANDLLPFEGIRRRDSSITEKHYRYMKYVHALYADYLKEHPEAGEFSKDTLSRSLNEYNKTIGDKINQFVGLDSKETKDLLRNGYNRISDILKTTPAQVFHNREEIQPGDRVIVFDDNTSTGFTEAQIKRTLGPKVMVPWVIYGLKVLTP